jgi:hypothetical protein
MLQANRRGQSSAQAAVLQASGSYLHPVQLRELHCW